MPTETEICVRCKRPGGAVFVDCPTCGRVSLCTDCALDRLAELALEAGDW
jgi:hypothetical protein